MKARTDAKRLIRAITHKALMRGGATLFVPEAAASSIHRYFVPCQIANRGNGR